VTYTQEGNYNYKAEETTCDLIAEIEVKNSKGPVVFEKPLQNVEISLLQQRPTNKKILLWIEQSILDYLDIIKPPECSTQEAIRQILRQILPAMLRDELAKKPSLLQDIQDKIPVD
jgi:hypothetical protein